MAASIIVLYYAIDYYIEIQIKEALKIKDVLTSKEAAEYLRITPETLIKLVKNGQLKGNKIGRNYLFLKEDLNSFIRGETE